MPDLEPSFVAQTALKHDPVYGRRKGVSYGWPKTVEDGGECHSGGSEGAGCGCRQSRGMRSVYGMIRSIT